jgi:DNA sulfur modification protein DndD
VGKELNQKEFKMLESKISKAFLIINIDPDKSEFQETTPQEFFNTYNNLYNAD